MIKLRLTQWEISLAIYYNNSFKFDDQTRAGEYGADFEGKIKLDEFIDLKTGRWIREEA